MVNGLFAAQKMQVTIDALILQQTAKDYLEDMRQEEAKVKKGKQLTKVVLAPSAAKQVD